MKPFKVVCIAETKTRQPSCSKTPDPKVNEIYTVNWVFENYYGLEELDPTECWSKSLFRPVQDIGGQVETHIQELIKKEDLQTISV